METGRELWAGELLTAHAGPGINRRPLRELASLPKGPAVPATELILQKAMEEETHEVTLFVPPSSREGTDESNLSVTWQPVSASISGALSEHTGDPQGGGWGV